MAQLQSRKGSQVISTISKHSAFPMHEQSSATLNEIHTGFLLELKNESTTSQGSGENQPMEVCSVGTTCLGGISGKAREDIEDLLKDIARHANISGRRSHVVEILARYTNALTAALKKSCLAHSNSDRVNTAIGKAINEIQAGTTVKPIANPIEIVVASVSSGQEQHSNRGVVSDSSHTRGMTFDRLGRMSLHRVEMARSEVSNLKKSHFKLPKNAKPPTPVNGQDISANNSRLLLLEGKP